jgi:hypothetical protein
MSGGNPNEYSAYLAPLHDKHVIGINNTYRIGTWIDVLFFGDCGWYLAHKAAVANFPKLKVTCCDRFANKNVEQSEGIKYLAKDKQKTRGISNNASTVSWNGNSGAAAISMAVHFGVKKIVLLGFDMALDANNVSHWHGSHNPGRQVSINKRKAPPFTRHMMGFPTIAADALRLGVEILNCSPISTITVFPKVSLKEVLDASGNTQSVEPAVDSGLTGPAGDTGLRASASPSAV